MRFDHDSDCPGLVPLADLEQTLTPTQASDETPGNLLVPPARLLRLMRDRRRVGVRMARMSPRSLRRERKHGENRQRPEQAPKL